VGIEPIGFRLAVGVAGAMALLTYSDLVRGPDREVLDPHPVQADLLLWAIARRTIRERAGLLIGALALTMPLYLGGEPLAGLGLGMLLLGAWLGMVGLGFAIHLGGVWAGLSPAAAGLLDGLRGGNPRMQAALIYAPGLALFALGALLQVATGGLSGALRGWAPGWALLMLPLAAGAAGYALALPLSRAWYVKATALLTEVEAELGGAPSAAEDQTVYMQGAAGEDPHLLRALRQGWRSFRPWALAPWAAGLLAAGLHWSGRSDAGGALAAAAGLALGLLPGRMAQEDPPWLDESLALRAGRVAWARAAAAMLYAAPCLVLSAAVGLLKQGSAALPAAVGLGLGVGMGVGAGALLAARYGGRSSWLVAPVGLLLWLGLGRLT
jgi:hypothetical protein